MPQLLPLAIIAVAVLTVAACGAQEPPRPSPVPSSSPSANPSAEPPPSPSTAAVSALVSIETRGGECPEGLCGSVISIEADGRVHQIRPTDRLIGEVPPDLLDALRVEIERANFALIASRPFTDTCPMAYDGQETIYVFTTGVGTGFERIASCEVAIDLNHPLFAAVTAIMRTVRMEGA